LALNDAHPRAGTRYRLAIIASHVIQYQTPLFRRLAEHEAIDLTVFFCSECGHKTYRDLGFGCEIKWDVPLTDGFKWRVLRNLNPQPSVASFFGLINPEVIPSITDKDFDAVWIFGWATCTNWLAWAAAQASGVRILILGESNLLTPLSPFRGFIKTLVLWCFFRPIGAFMSIGSNTADFYKFYGVPWRKIFHVPYAVNNAYFFEHSDKASQYRKLLRTQLELSDETILILFVGKLISAKRPLDLLRAYETASEKSNMAVVFVGDGNLRGELEAYVNRRKLRNVSFAGFKNQTELPLYYSSADLLVLPSGFERWGLVVNEAMCFGLPIIASSAVGAAKDLVRDGENGYVYDSGNTTMLATCLLRLKESSIRNRMSRRSREIISKWSYEEDVIGILGALRGSHEQR